MVSGVGFTELGKLGVLAAAGVLQRLASGIPAKLAQIAYG